MCQKVLNDRLDPHHQIIFLDLSFYPDNISDMCNISKRILKINLPAKQSAFLWGPRKTGKSYWLKNNFKDHILIDLLKSDIYADYVSRPSLLRERYMEYDCLIIIDEIQMVPSLLNEIHWLIENSNLSFLMTGSSSRKLRRKHSNLLGGRAWSYSMRPLTYKEVQGFDLERIMISGLLPPHFLSLYPIQDIRSYIGDYLKEEIASEALVQNIPFFAEFLRVAAITSGELLNYTNVGRESGVSAKVVRSYFQILEDTLLGFRVAPWRKSKNRRLIETEKFYLFDIGITNFLARRKPALFTPEFGKSFEHFILMELMAYQAYKDPDIEIRYWRTSTGMEVDFIINDMEVAIEVKSSFRVHENHLNGIKALLKEHKVRRSIVVSLEKIRRKVSGSLEIIPWQDFLEELWAGTLF